jgi:hypothetical protein
MQNFCSSSGLTSKKSTLSLYQIQMNDKQKNFFFENWTCWNFLNIFACNRTRNEYFACVQQAAKLNFAAVALTTAVKVSHFYIYLLLQHIYLYISGVILHNLDWLQ